jgi:superfamily II DNA or RNA helicase
MFKFYPHQNSALKSIMKNVRAQGVGAKGRIVIPTGGGKTAVEAVTLKWQFRKEAGASVHLVLAPRILLCNQLLNEYRKILGNDYMSLAFHSGHHEPDYADIAWKEESTTSPTTVADYIERSEKLNKPLVIFSTYHSSHRLNHIDFQTMIADESQYCVAENFNESIVSINANLKLFFTATEKFTASNSGYGLNNVDTYGDRWFYVPARELIAAGIIVAPRLHLMHGQVTDTNQSVLSEIIEIGKKQIELTDAMPYAKVLYATNGTDDIKTVEDNMTEIQVEFPGYDIFTITSKHGPKINGKEIKREKFLEKLKVSKNSLVFHYDILSEGIDVDGITGVVLMRNMSLSKLLQTIGRAVRLYKADPLLKPQAWVSVPVINSNKDDAERVRLIILALRDGGYDISFEDIIETKQNNHEKEDEDLEDAFDDYKNNFSSLFLEEIKHETDFWNNMNKAKTVDDKLELLIGSEI